MNMNDLHSRLLRDILEVGSDLPSVITGGYAIQAHGIVDRLSRDIDVATNSSIPMEILATVSPTRSWSPRAADPPGKLRSLAPRLVPEVACNSLALSAYSHLHCHTW